MGGLDAAIDGRRFWDGATVQDKVLVDRGLPFVPQDGNMNCGPASSESMSRGAHSQQDVRATLGGNPNRDGLEDGKIWKDFETRTGRSYHGAHGSKFEVNDVYSHLQNGNDISFSMRGDIGHAVNANRITERTITKISGKVLNKLFLEVMNPAQGQYVPFNQSQISNSNVWIIFR